MRAHPSVWITMTTFPTPEKDACLPKARDMSPSAVPSAVAPSSSTTSKSSAAPAIVAQTAAQSAEKTDYQTDPEVVAA